MRMSEAGFLRPEQIDALSAEEERLIARTCPGIGLTQDSQEGTDHPIWGPLVAVRTGIATDASLRHHASSGGVLSALLLYLVELKIVDYVVHTTASNVSPIENAIVESANRAGVFAAAGSRYAPSAPLAALHRQLAQPGRFALVAKPCDVAAVRALGHHDHRVNEKIPIILSFFCGGVPSVHGARESFRGSMFVRRTWPAFAIAVTAGLVSPPPGSRTVAKHG